RASSSALIGGTYGSRAAEVVPVSVLALAMMVGLRGWVVRSLEQFPLVCSGRVALALPVPAPARGALAEPVPPKTPPSGTTDRETLQDMGRPAGPPSDIHCNLNRSLRLRHLMLREPDAPHRQARVGGGEDGVPAREVPLADPRPVLMVRLDPIEL